MEEVNDTEITLGTGKMLALFFGLVILCAVFFWHGILHGQELGEIDTGVAAVSRTIRSALDSG